jgi:hypothetical protein
MGGATVDILARLKLAGGQFSRDFKTQMDGVEREARSSASRINAAWRGVSSGIGGLAAGVGVAALAVAGKRALDYASSLGEVSQQLGVTTKDLQVYRFAATQVGIEQEAMDKSLAKLTRTIGEAANGGKQQQRVFQALGIDIRDTSGHIKTAGELIPELAGALEGVHNPAQRAAVLVQLFGKSGQQLETLLAGGRGQVDGLRDSAERLGIVLSDKQIQSADETADKLAALKQVMEARIAGVVADNAQAILQFATSIATLSTNLAGWWAQNPEKAFGLMGAGGGFMMGSRLGPWGALAGTAIGYLAGSGSAPDTPDSLRRQAEYFRTNARNNARGYGYYDDDATPEDRARILRMGGVRNFLDQAKNLLARAEALEKSVPIAATAAAARTAAATLDLKGLNGGDGGSGTRTNEEAFRDFERELARRGIHHAAGRYGFRTAADQNEIYRTQPGSTPLDGYRRVSRHQAWEAFDPTRASHNEEAAYAAAREAGLKGFRIVSESGGRKHYEWTGHGAKGDIGDALAEQEQAEQAAARAAEQRREEQERILEAMRQQTASEVEGVHFAGLRARGLDREAELRQQLYELERDGAAQLAKLPPEQSKVTEGLQDQLSLAWQQAGAFADLLRAHGDREALTDADKQAEAEKLTALETALEAARDMAKSAADQLAIDEAILQVKHKIADAADDGAAAAARQKKEDEEAQARFVKQLEEQRDAQEQQIQDLADFWERAFRSGGKSVWEDFKDQGYHILAQLAAQWTMALLSGQKISLPGALEQLGAMSGAGGGGGGFNILSLFGMDGGGGIAGAASRAPGGGFGGGNPATRMADLEKVVAGLQDPGAAGGGMAGMGQLAGSIGQAVPYVAAAMAATTMLSKLLGVKNHAGGLFGLGGNLLINEMTPAKRGSATLGFDQYGQLGVGSSRGNSSTRVDAAKDAIGSVSDTLQRIADTLHGSLTGPVTASIGMREGNWRVDPSGRGITKTKNGAIDFGKDAEAAARYLVGEALRDGVVAGISDASKRILASGQDLERAIEKAGLIESIPERLAAYLDPVGAQLDELNKRWEKTIAALREGGASAEEMAKAQQLYKLELAETKSTAREASANLKDFLNSLAFGSASPYSLRDQEQKAFEALKPFLDQIDSKERVDQGKYAEAASAYLEIERALGGSTSAFFDKLSMVQDYTNRAIADIDNAKPIRTVADPFIEATASNTLTSAEILAEVRDRAANTEALLGRILSAVSGGGGGGFIGGARGFVRSDVANYE